jgi:hypothetical protein
MSRETYRNSIIEKNASSSILPAIATIWPFICARRVALYTYKVASIISKTNVRGRKKKRTHLDLACKRKVVSF